MCVVYVQRAEERNPPPWKGQSLKRLRPLALTCPPPAAAGVSGSPPAAMHPSRRGARRACAAVSTHARAGRMAAAPVAGGAAGKRAAPLPLLGGSWHSQLWDAPQPTSSHTPRARGVMMTRSSQPLPLCSPPRFRSRPRARARRTPPSPAGGRRYSHHRALPRPQEGPPRLPLDPKAFYKLSIVVVGRKPLASTVRSRANTMPRATTGENSSRGPSSLGPLPTNRPITSS